MKMLEKENVLNRLYKGFNGVYNGHDHSIHNTEVLPLDVQILSHEIRVQRS